ncbi:hypothetical protein [Hyphomicrobium sp. 99]|nr:hypothetical protein [Hyphomicrobium sp. 99]
MQLFHKIIVHIVLVAGLALIVGHYGHLGEAFTPADAQSVK